MKSSLKRSRDLLFKQLQQYQRDMKELHEQSPRQIMVKVNNQQLKEMASAAESKPKLDP